MLELNKHLNSSQAAAVTTLSGALLVIAGAGSGKTRVIEYRVLHLIQNGIKPESILLLTFTRKASYEMLSRAQRNDSRSRRVDGGTFHSFAYRMLKRHGSAISLSKDFTILDEGDQEEAIQRCLARLGYNEKKKGFPRKSTIRDIISMSVNKGVPFQVLLETKYPNFFEYADDIKKIASTYAAYKVSKNYLDYDDLLIYLKLLLQNESVRKNISSRYKHVMVDEYQDTNVLQDEISYLLAKDHGNIMVVGDDAQSIYGFRGTCHENIMRFPERFPGAKIIKLEDNYRSSQSILNVANAILGNMENSYSKCLRANRKQDHERPKLLFFKDSYEEAGYIAGKIAKMRDDLTRPLNDVAVLFRAAWVSILLQAELSKLKIPFQVFGGLRFYETAHVKDITAHLKVLHNPKDELSWARILMLIEGIGQKTSDRLIDDIMGCSSIKEIVGSILGKNLGQKFHKDLKRLGEAFTDALSGSQSPSRWFSVMLNYYMPIFKSRFDDYHYRINDLEALKQISGRYKDPATFLADFAIEPPDRGVAAVEGKIQKDEKPLTLSTIHSAKGLEWNSVFLMGLADGILPSSFALNDKNEIEEEARLLYVAITRAKEDLFLSLHHEGHRGGINQFNKISRFLDRDNILKHLEQEAVIEPDSRVRDIDDIDIHNERIYDRDTLLRNVMDYYQ